MKIADVSPTCVVSVLLMYIIANFRSADQQNIFYVVSFNIEDNLPII